MQQPRSAVRDGLEAERPDAGICFHGDDRLAENHVTNSQTASQIVFGTCDYPDMQRMHPKSDIKSRLTLQLGPILWPLLG
jgi:hypothetical protein